MKTFFLEVLKRLLMAIFVSLILLILSYSFVSGEFPPNLKNMKNGIFNLRSQVTKIRKLQELKLAQATEDIDSSNKKNPIQNRNAELSKLLEEFSNSDTNSQPIKPVESVMTLEQLEKQNIVLVRKIAELEFRIHKLEKNKK